MINYRIILSILFSCLLLSFQASTKLSRYKVTKNISVSVPQNFHEMNDDEISAKYFTYRRPISMFADASGKVNFGINLSETPWQPDDIQTLAKVYKSNIMNTYTNVKMMQEDIIKAGNKKIAVFEFLGRLDGDAASAFLNQGALTQYHYIAYSTMGHQIAIFNFNCSVRYHQAWRGVAHDIIQSIKITSSK